MGRGKKVRDSGAKVVEIESDKPAAEQKQAAQPPKPETPAEPQVKRRTTSFFDRVRKIPKADWGTRAFIYVYCLEPICNLKMGGETKYLVKLKEPIFDEDPIMIDYGSGKYRLQLVQRKPGADQSDQTDVTEIEIYNPKYPPKIPRSVWMNDPRNERWASLLPKEETPQPPTPLGSVTDAFKTFTEIRKDLRDEITPPSAAATNDKTDVDRFTSMVVAVKSIMPQAAPATDNKVLDTVLALMMKQIDASQTETRELRAQLMQTIQKKQNEGETDAVSTLEKIIAKADVLIPKLKNLFGVAGEEVTKVVHGRARKWWEELLVQTVPPVAQSFSPLLQGLVARAMGPAPIALNPAPSNGAQAQPAATPTPLIAAAQRIHQFILFNMRPLQRYFENFVKGTLVEGELEDGTDFAYWISDNYGPELLNDARTLGIGHLLEVFHSTPFWPAIAPHEPKLIEFLNQMLTFEPEPEGNEPTSQPMQMGPANDNETDLTSAQVPQGAL